MAPSILNMASQLINISPALLTSLGLSSVTSLSLGHRIAYCVAMLDLLDLIPEENYNTCMRVSRSKLEHSLRRLGSPGHDAVPSVLDLLVFVPHIISQSSSSTYTCSDTMTADVSQVLYLLWFIQDDLSSFSTEISRLRLAKRFCSVSSNVSKHGHLLHIAARRGASSSVLSLLSWDPESVLDLDDKGKTALHALACGSLCNNNTSDSDNIRETARLLLDAGVNMWQRSVSNGQTVFSIPMRLPLLREVLYRAVRESNKDYIEPKTRTWCSSAWYSSAKRENFNHVSHVNTHFVVRSIELTLISHSLITLNITTTRIRKLNSRFALEYRYRTRKRHSRRM